MKDIYKLYPTQHKKMPQMQPAKFNFERNTIFLHSSFKNGHITSSHNTSLWIYLEQQPKYGTNA